ncbi:MAG: hypothetical protein ACP5JY_03230, partial [Candidatus Nanoarchaeia archaeon]
MTYGWAILIIAVVLGALFQLGVFNANNFAPKAPPGSCQVFRPNGPGTTSFINLEGICSGELPQYVAQFNGQSSYISGTMKNIFPITETAWIYPKPPSPTDWFGIMSIDGGDWESFVASSEGLLQPQYQKASYEGGADVCKSGSLLWSNSSVTLCTPNTVNFYTWNFVVFSVNGTSMRACINMRCTSKSISIGGPIQAVSSWNIGG